LKYNATSLTKAGAENQLLSLAIIPPILLLEEVEKCIEANLPWLLSVMDFRGEVRKTNAHIGTVAREAKCLVLATCNDYSKFHGIMSGALSSRFTHQLYCPRPSREAMVQILTREVTQRGWDLAWVEPAVQIAFDEEGNSDPRRAIAVLDGHDRLLTGAYQDDWRQINKAKEADPQMIAK
jgi:hypothetical protein